MSFALRIALAFLIIFLLEFYFRGKFVNAIALLTPKINPKKLKRIILIILLYINIYPFYLLFAWLLSTQRVSLPDHTLFDYFIIYPFWVSIFIIFQVVLILLPIDLLRILLFPAYKKYKGIVTAFSRKFTLIITAFFILYVPGRIIYDYQTVSIRIKEFRINNLHPDLQGLKITFISDLQADRYTDEKRLNNYIEKVNSTNPDLVLVAGDFITSTPDYIDQAAKLAGNIKAKYGVYSCVGDHDHWAYRDDTRKSVREIGEALAKHNIKMIDNDKIDLQIGNSEIRLTFITNTYVNRLIGNAVDSLLDGTGYDFKILIVHQPGNSLIEKAKIYNYNLFLAGHTHGGQVTFLFPFMQISPTMFETKYMRGDFYFDDMLMVINRGLGMSLVPFRYNSTPEVTVIILNNR
jgi:predicted MPP superfamily phosphohydrolase